MTPPQIEADLSELRLAWRRLKLDRPDRCFVNHPHLLDWVDSDADAWLEALRVHLAKGYGPSACRVCWVPKPGSLLRPAAILQLGDEVVYNVLVGRLLPAIHRVLERSQASHDMAYQLQTDPSTPAWFRTNWFEQLEDWRTLSLALLEDSAFVVITDIAGFYENIDLQKLSSDVRAACGDGAELALLRACLGKWSTPREKGLPQGHSASDILAKLYLHTLDVSLMNEHFNHLRYVDDIRVFCGSRREARLALRRLSELMYRRGLNLQAAKTRIVSRAEAQAIIEGVTPTIELVSKRIREEIEKEFDTEGPYLPQWKLDVLLGQSQGLPTEILERTFEDYFAASSEVFDKRLLHFLLRRLGACGSRVAVEYCLNLLLAHPEETKAVAQYFLSIGLEKEDEKKIVRYMASPDALYDYQLHQLLKMFYDARIERADLLALCRRWLADSSREPWVLSYASAYVGTFGDTNDLETLVERYGVLTNEIQKAEVVAALQRMERSKRNAFYARVEGEGMLVSQAARRARSMRERQTPSPP